MVAVKKVPAVPECRSHKEVQVVRENSKPAKSFAGFIFVCNKDTLPDLDRKIFGLPAYHEESVRAIRRGMPLFLFNYSTRCLCGVFEAASDGGMNLDPHAWEDTCRHDRVPVSRYPAQVKFHSRFQRPPLLEDTFRPVIGYKFKLELSKHQVLQLLRLFHVPEKEFFGDLGVKQINHTPVASAVDTDSPRSSFKSDSDCLSECSSKGYTGDEELVDDGCGENRNNRGSVPTVIGYDESMSTMRRNVHVAGSHEQILTQHFGHMSLSDVPNNQHKLWPEHFVNRVNTDLRNHFCRQPVSKTNTVKTTRIFYPLPREKLGSKNSGIYYPIPREKYVPVVTEDSDANTVETIEMLQSSDLKVHPLHDCKDALAMPMAQFPATAAENLTYPTMHPPMHPVIADIMPISVQKPNENDQPQGERILKASTEVQNMEKHRELKHGSPEMPHENQQIHTILPSELQLGQIPLPFTLQNPGAIFLVPNGPVFSLCGSQVGPIEAHEEGQIPINGPPLQPNRSLPFLQGGPVPVCYLPPQVIRRTPSHIAPGNTQVLHCDILCFAKLTRPSSEVQLYVESAIDCVRSCVRTMWPDSDVEVYGSFATGLCLQHSDVDLAVVDAPHLPSMANMSTSQASVVLLKELCMVIKSCPWCENLEMVSTASVPVLKCQFRPTVRPTDPSVSMSLISIDITIGGISGTNYTWNPDYRFGGTGKLSVLGKVGNQHTGGAAREYVLSKIRLLPALVPIVLLLKSFLHHKKLSNVYLGGLGSFSLTLLVAYYLERLPLLGVFPDVSLEDLATSLHDLPAETKACLKDDLQHFSLGEFYVSRAAVVIDKVIALWESGGAPYLGVLLLGFLWTFGFELDLSCEKIVLRGIDGSPGGMFKRRNRHIALWIDNPLRPGVNVGAGSYGMCHVQAAFREMYQVLTQQQLPVSPLFCNNRDCQDMTAFSRLLILSRLLPS